MAQSKKHGQPVAAFKQPKAISSVVNVSRVIALEHAATTTLMVGVRVRPILKSELAKGGRKDILRVLDSRVVLVLDPDDSKDYLDQVQNRTKEKRYTFDVAFGPEARNSDVYEGTVKELVAGVTQGLNATVFAYGATGSGKTYTMVGKPEDPGLMVLSLQHIFKDIATMQEDDEFDVTCSYLEVYNEIIYDLLINNSGPLDLREDPEMGVVVAGLCKVNVDSPQEIMALLEDGNRRRKTEATDANSQSSRSHAVLEIVVQRLGKNGYKVKHTWGKLSLVDLAGSERAAETNNEGRKLRDGANINRSLLALANCINALGKQQKNGISYVPYRNSKLTRLLKDGLSGNSRTAMIAAVSASSDQYHHSINTLKYADRAKEIKTHIVQNIGSIEKHIADYKRIIDNLQTEVHTLRTALEEVQSNPVVDGAAPDASNDIQWVEALAAEINENVEERINLQKALFELEDLNVVNRAELKTLDEFLDSTDLCNASNHDILDARRRRAVVLESIKENEEEIKRYRDEVKLNEEARKEIQQKIESQTINQSPSFLKIINTFRIQAVKVQELKFQMAVRDQVISEQRDVISNLWRIMEAAGMGRDRILGLAQQEGILMEDPEGSELSDGTPALGAAELQRAMQAVRGMQDNGDLEQLVRSADVQRDGQQHKGRFHGPHMAAMPSLTGRTADYKYRFWSKRLPTDYKVPGLEGSGLDGSADAGEPAPSVAGSGSSGGGGGGSGGSGGGGGGGRPMPQGRSKIPLITDSSASTSGQGAGPRASRTGQPHQPHEGGGPTPPRKRIDFNSGAHEASPSKHPKGANHANPVPTKSHTSRRSEGRSEGHGDGHGHGPTHGSSHVGAGRRESSTNVPTHDGPSKGRRASEQAPRRRTIPGAASGGADDGGKPPQQQRGKPEWDSDTGDAPSSSNQAWEDAAAAQRAPSKLGQAPLAERLAKFKAVKRQPSLSAMQEAGGDDDEPGMPDRPQSDIVTPDVRPASPPPVRRHSDGNGNVAGAPTERQRSFVQLQQQQQHRRDMLSNLNHRVKAS